MTVVNVNKSEKRKFNELLIKTGNNGKLIKLSIHECLFFKCSLLNPFFNAGSCLKTFFNHDPSDTVDTLPHN